MKYKIAAFFAGRNGMDDLSRLTLWTSLIVMLISGFLPVPWLSGILYGLGWAGLIYAYYRAFSKKLSQRQKENYAYLTLRNQKKMQWAQRKTHKFYRCPQCKTVLRVPKGKGKINIACKSCGNHFVKKT